MLLIHHSFAWWCVVELFRVELLASFVVCHQFAV